ncbi:MAG: DUF6600 domain-containing protein [Polymorphobacter sp.]
MFFARCLTAFAPVLLLSGCTYDFAEGYAPVYPPGYDSGIGSGDVVQPGDMFGGQNIASVELFYGPLARFGRWADTRFGYAFIPNVQAGWRPYVNGRWGDSRLWISNDPWGWATDHYGRWGFDARIGWVWVPATEWAPSWVAWREDADVTGWAPIPPGINYSVSIGFGGGARFDDWNSWYGPSWVWVPRSYLYRPGFGTGPLPWQGGRDYWRTSQWQRNTGWNGRPGYQGWHRPGVLRPNSLRPGYGRPPARDGGWQGRPHRDGRQDQWQGRPGRSRPSEGQSVDGQRGIGQRTPWGDQPRQPAQRDYRPTAGVAGGEIAPPPPRSGGNSGAVAPAPRPADNGGSYRPAPRRDAAPPPPRAEPPAPRASVPARKNQYEQPD